MILEDNRLAKNFFIFAIEDEEGHDEILESFKN